MRDSVIPLDACSCELRLNSLHVIDNNDSIRLQVPPSQMKWYRASLQYRCRSLRHFVICCHVCVSFHTLISWYCFNWSSEISSISFCGINLLDSARLKVFVVFCFSYELFRSFKNREWATRWCLSQAISVRCLIWSASVERRAPQLGLGGGLCNFPEGGAR